MRDQTEWAELLYQNTNILSEPDNIFEVYKKILGIKGDFSKNHYGDGNASSLILDAILNYFG